MTTADFYGGHISGLHHARPEVWQRAIAACMAAGAEFITLTETTHDDLFEGDNSIVPEGWGLVRIDDERGQSECSIIYDRSRRTQVGPGFSLQAAQTRFKLPGGFVRPPVHVTGVALQDKGGKVDVVAAVHFPAGTEGARPTKRERRRGFAYWLSGPLPRQTAFIETVAGLKAAWRFARDEVRAEGHRGRVNRIVGFDANLDTRKAWVRLFWAAAFPGLHLGTLIHGPKRGRRKIDRMAHSTGLASTGTVLLPHVDGLDHEGPIVTGYRRLR